MSKGVALNSIQAILFDVDGTLVDSLEKIIAGLSDGFEHANGTRPSREYLLSLIGRSLREQMQLAAPNADASRIEKLEAYTIRRYDAHCELERPFAPALDVLQLAHQSGLKTALVTSKNSVELEAFLNRFTHAEYVTTTVSASDVAHPKPAPDSAILACEKVSIDPSQAVMIGDSLWDLRCAKSAGVKFIAVSYGSADKDSLLAEEPDMIFDTPHELRHWAQEELKPLCLGKK